MVSWTGDACSVRMSLVHTFIHLLIFIALLPCHRVLCGRQRQQRRTFLCVCLREAMQAKTPVKVILIKRDAVIAKLRLFIHSRRILSVLNFIVFLLLLVLLIFLIFLLVLLFHLFLLLISLLFFSLFSLLCPLVLISIVVFVPVLFRSRFCLRFHSCFLYHPLFFNFFP